MSNLPGNPFAGLIEPLSGQHAEVAVGLALAYEQRTANLIAYIETFGGGIDYDDIWHDISARLGMGDAK